MKSLKQHFLLSALLLLFSGAASAQTTTQERAEEPEMAADTRERPMRHSIEQRRGEHLQRLERGRRPTVRQRPTLRQRRVKAHRPGIKAAQNPRIAKKTAQRVVKMRKMQFRTQKLKAQTAKLELRTAKVRSQNMKHLRAHQAARSTCASKTPESVQ